MMLPNPLNSTEVYVFSREEYALISIRCGMFVMLRVAMKFDIMLVQMHQITTLSTDQRLSTLNGLPLIRVGSSEFMNVGSIHLCGMTCLGVCLRHRQVACR